MNILITGFEPFNDHQLNSSSMVAEQLTQETIPGVSVFSLILPVEFLGAWDVLQEHFDNGNYQAVIALGQADPRILLSVERVAINIKDARIPDNKGNQPKDTPIIESAPPAYFATLPIKAMVDAAANSSITCEISNTAGTYVCNELMFHLLHFCLKKEIPAGFVHCPLLPEQSVDGQTGMPLDQQVRGLTAMIKAIKHNLN